MGDVQSSQGASEEENQQAVAAKPWSPDDISSESSEEEETSNTNKNKSVVAEPKPPDPPQNAKKSKQRGKRKSTESSTSARESDREVIERVISVDNSARASTDHRSPPKSTQKSDEPRSARRRSERKNKFEVMRSGTNNSQPDTEDSEVHDMIDTQETPESQMPQDSEAQANPMVDESPSKPLQVRLKTQTTRYPCPQADAFKCEKTFATEASAKRHSQIHTHKYSHKCTVCSNTYSRADKLRTHRLVHTVEELREADELAQNQSEQETNGDQVQAEAVPASPENGVAQRDPRMPNEVPETLSEGAEDGGASTPIATNITEQSSTKTSTTDTSIFDEPDEPEVIQETPRPKSRLKRKRPTPKAQSSINSTDETSHKRRRRNVLSPPTSVASDEEGASAKEDEVAGRSSSDLFDLPKVPKPKVKKSGNLDNFAQPWIPGSKLHHPIHNPHSPRFGSSQQVRVIIPRSSNGGPSTVPTEKASKQLQRLASDESDVEKTPLATKGKNVVYTSPKGKRKAEKGIRYSSPPKNKADDNESELEPRNMATSVARKGDSGDKSLKRKSSATASSTVKAPRVKAKSNDDDDDDEGRKGQFSVSEINKLNKWRDNFCDEYDINTPTFNQMMTDSCRRGKNFHWPYRIKKTTFIKEYLEVLPGRDKRSMFRFRERHFQNVPDNQTWTTEDDSELTDLVNELGQKWVEIGQRMTRTQDSVSQRWRFKLQYRDKLNTGEWLPSEEEKLKEAFAQVKQESNLPLDPLTTGDNFSWASVSAKLKGKRTAQQCSNKWRLMHQKREGNKFIKSELDGTVGASSKTATPSKMTQRLSGQTPSKSQPSSKKKVVSKERVHDSEDDEDNEEDDKSESANELSTNEDASQETARKSRRNPLASHTPQASSSLSQAFAQTQANTSALRAPTTSRKKHTQTEMPTPGIPIQHQLASSPLRSIKSGNLDPEQSDDTAAQTKSQKQKDDTDAIMADPESSSEDETTQSEATSSESLIDNEASEATGSEETSSNADSSSSEAESSPDEMVQSTQKDSFIASLRSPSNRSSFSSRADKRTGKDKLYWERLVRGEAERDSESESDEGDIMHH